MAFELADGPIRPVGSASLLGRFGEEAARIEEAARMGKLPAVFYLGNDLRMHRKTARLTQTDLARAARLVERTVRVLDPSRGQPQLSGVDLRPHKH